MDSPIAFFLPHFRPSGGVKVYLAIAIGLAQRMHRVVLATCEPDGPLRSALPPSVEVVPLAPSSRIRARLAPLRAPSLTAAAFLGPVTLETDLHPAMLYVDALAGFLSARRPRSLYSGGVHENAAAWLAKTASGAPTSLIFSEHNTLTRHHPYGRGLRQLWLPPLVRRTYPDAAAIVAVSSALADDVARRNRLDRSRIQVIHNPAVPDDIAARTAEPVDHPWFAPGAAPVILGAGRLSAAKDFRTLVEAFALVRAQREARLVILGAAKTPKKTAKNIARLQRLADDLGVGSDLWLPGMVANPLAYMARAGLYVLSSRQEGLPTVLIEALASGCPCVATDCPSGPREILDGGRYGRLVPVGEPRIMADAILATLAAPPDRALCLEAAERFRVTPAIDAYEALLAPAADPAKVAPRSDGQFSDGRSRATGGTTRDDVGGQGGGGCAGTS